MSDPVASGFRSVRIAAVAWAMCAGALPGVAGAEFPSGEEPDLSLASHPSPVLSVIFANPAPSGRAAAAGLQALGPDAARRLVELGVVAIEPAFPSAPRRGTVRSIGDRQIVLPDLSRFQHLIFGHADEAVRALPELRAWSEFRLVEALSISPVLGIEPARGTEMARGTEPVLFPDDPYFLSWPWGWPDDPQWSLRNQGRRGGGARCAPAIPGADVGIDQSWRTIEAAIRAFGHGFSLSPYLGAPEVVLGFLDVGLLDAHPDLRVLEEFSRDPRLSLCPETDWCGDHGTKMAGLASARAGNGIGVAGVCGECAVLDLNVPSCPCSNCDSPEANCLFVSHLWHTRLVAAVDFDLGRTQQGKARRLAVVNASFASTGQAPLEVLEALWYAHLSGVLVVAASGDQSLAAPAPRFPANVPFVLGVGGSTWEDRFWDARVSCYGGTNGTTVDRHQIDLAAPASGAVVTTFVYDNPSGAGLYAPTTGQCSAAAALVSGAAGVVSAHAPELSPDDLSGVLLASARPYRLDPTLEATCPPELCPRAFYGRGVVDLENALHVVAHRARWETLRLTERAEAPGATWERQVVAEYTSGGALWREYRVVATVPLRARPPGGPADLPEYVAWPAHTLSTTPLAYGVGAGRIGSLESGATGFELEVDPATGVATATGANFCRVVGGLEEPQVPWAELAMVISTWPHRGRTDDPPPIEPVGGLELRVWPNPFRSAAEILAPGLPQDDRARCEIFDAAGRLVRTLPPGYSPAFDRRWDGRDSEGRPVPPGVYWVRLFSGRGTATCPLVRIE